MSFKQIQKRRLILWTIAGPLALFATWILFNSIGGQGGLGIIIGGAWLVSILFNSYTLDCMSRGSMPRTVTHKQQQTRPSVMVGVAR